ncbi:hypothetical protein FACS1894141_7280 [Spirochaetia bacterium]|nr:hypothetical protein FACS1894141_7280 [Spirochaetia bacterium]
MSKKEDNRITDEEQAYIDQLEKSYKKIYLAGIKKGLEVARRPIMTEIKIVKAKK